MKWFGKMASSNEWKIGVAGFSDDSKFYAEEAKEAIKEAFDDAEERAKGKKLVLVSGLTSVGIPNLAHLEAKRRGWKSVGLSAQEAKEYDCYDADEEIIVGEKFGDESDTFVDYIDELITFGGGKQTKAEAKKAREEGLKVTEVALEERS
jgi:predicted Rossmann-fold nucleotide-binding protein